MISPQFVIYCIIGLAVAGYIARCEYISRDRAQFIAKLEAQAEQQKKENEAKEKANAKKINDALTERDAALKRLRERSSPVSLSSGPTAPVGSKEFCLDSAGYNAAIGRYRERLERGLVGVQSIAIQCGEAEIDAKALLDSWPK